MEKEVRLDPSEVVVGRPFSDCEMNRHDLEAMRLMAVRLREVVEGAFKPAPAPWVLRQFEAGRQHRIVVLNRNTLLSAHHLVAVGFFGQSRSEVEPGTCEELQTVDWELVEEFARHAGVLSYSTLKLENGDYGDLAVLSDPQACQHWMGSARHAYAANELSPRCYLSVRLQSGVLPGGLRSGRDPVLLQTKYFDFRQTPPWRARRVLVTETDAN